MLNRVAKSYSPCLRHFSGSDQYWLHLKPIKDNYPQYAHLHWHTIDPLEIGKYAKYRSKEMYGDHVSENPHPHSWTPETESLTKITEEMRDDLYENFDRWADSFSRLLETNEDLSDPHHEGHTLADTSNELLLSIIKPKQIHEALKLAQKLVDDYKAAGVAFTRQSIIAKSSKYLLDSLSLHQIHKIEHGMIPYLNTIGAGVASNDD